MLLNSNQVKFFNNNGYLILDNFFTDKELDDFTNAFRHLIQFALKKASQIHLEIKLEDYVGKEFDEGMMKLEEIDHTFVSDIYDTIYQVPEFLRIVAKSETTQCINQLMNKTDDNPLYTYTSRCRIDPPDDERRTTKWHQEVFYTIPKNEFLQTWAPIILDTNSENGSIEFCPGSNKNGIAKQSFNDAKGVATPFVVNNEIVQNYKTKQVDMKLGQIMIFSSRLIHCSGQNKSKNIRYSLVGMYHVIDTEHFTPTSLNFQFKEISPEQYYREEFS